MNQSRALLAAILQFKPSIFSKIVLRDHTLRSKIGLEVRVHPQVEPFIYANISKAVSDAVNSSEWIQVEASKRQYKIKYQDGLILFRLEGADKGEDVFSYLPLAFAPIEEIRQKFLEFVFEDLSVSQEKIDYFKSIANQRIFSHSDYEELMNEIITMPVPVIQDIESKWMSQKVLFQDLLPQSRQYYENLIGSDNGLNVDEYLDESFPNFIEKIFLQSPPKGVHYCFPTMIKASFDPNKYLNQVADDQLWEILKTVDLRKNYFSLLNVLKVAIFRSKEKDRFYSLAEDCVNQILNNPDGSLYSHVYFGSIVDFCIRHLSVNPDTASMSTTWRRVAGFAHANILIDILKLSASDQLRFIDDLKKVITLENTFVGIRDQADEPLWTSLDLNGVGICVEITKQLQDLFIIFDPQSRLTELKEKVDSFIEEQRKNVNFAIRFGSPGPFEAHHNSSRTRSLMDNESFEAIASVIRENVYAEKPWALLSQVCKTHVLSKEMISKISEWVENLAFTEEKSSPFFDCIGLASYIGSSQSSEILAESVKEKIKASLGILKTSEEVRAAIFVLVLSSGGVIKEKRSHWLADTITQMAYLLPKGSQCQAFEDVASALSNYIPLNETKWSKAIKIASIGR